MVLRGLLLLGMMLVIVAMVWVVLMRAPGRPQPAATDHSATVALAVPTPTGSFPGNLNWGALAELSESLPSSPGWEVRYNAAVALARRGSEKIPLDVLAEMLDESIQMRNFRVRLVEGGQSVDEFGARNTVLNALKALEEWSKHKDTVRAVGGTEIQQLQRVHAAVVKLTQSTNDVVRQEAERVKIALAIGKS